LNPKQSGDYHPNNPLFSAFQKRLILLNVYRPAEHTLTGYVIRAIIPLFLLAKENSVITNVAQFGNSHARHQVFEIIALFMSNCVVHVKNEIGFFWLLQIVSVDGIEFR
jgi:hypothetical protein